MNAGRRDAAAVASGAPIRWLSRAGQWRLTLLAAIDDMILDQAVLEVSYTRDDQGSRT